jgi:hypothetical protein
MFMSHERKGAGRLICIKFYKILFQVGVYFPDELFTIFSYFRYRSIVPYQMHLQASNVWSLKMCYFVLHNVFIISRNIPNIMFINGWEIG